MPVVGIGADQRGTDDRRGLDAAGADAMMAFRSMVPDDIAAPERDRTAGPAADQQPVLVIRAGDEIEPGPRSSGMQVAGQGLGTEGDRSAVNEAGLRALLSE